MMYRNGGYLEEDKGVQTSVHHQCVCLRLTLGGKKQDLLCFLRHLNGDKVR